MREVWKYELFVTTVIWIFFLESVHHGNFLKRTVTLWYLYSIEILLINFNQSAVLGTMLNHDLGGPHVNCQNIQKLKMAGVNFPWSY